MEKKTLPELYLEKLELLTPKERDTLLKAIDLLNSPIFMAGGDKITRITP